MKTALNLKRIYFYGDSIVYGFNGKPGGRYSPKERFTGILQDSLGDEYDIIEDGLRSRTTDVDDPKLKGRNGLTAFYSNVGAQLPFDLLVIMLGTNDCKAYLNRDIVEVGPALDKYFEALRYNVELFKLTMPKVLLVSPPLIDPLRYDALMGEFFQNQAVPKGDQLTVIIKSAADKHNAAFLDAAQVVGASTVDGIHLDIEQNKQLAEALAKLIPTLLN